MAIMDIYILSSSKKLLAKKIWKSLEKECLHTPLNAQWEYVNTWLSVYGNEVPHWFFYAKEDAYIGIVLLVKHKGRNILFPVDSFSIGPDGEPYNERTQMAENGILVKENYKALFLKKVTELIKKEFKWEEITIDALSEKEAYILSPFLKAENCNLTNEEEYVFDIDMVRREQKDILSALPYNVRYKVRRSMKAFGNLRIDWANTKDEAFSIFYEMKKLHQIQWKKKGRPGVFASRKFTLFHHNLIHRLFPQGKIGLTRISDDRLGTIGCLYFFIDNGTVYGCLCGFKQFTQNDFPNVNIKRIKPGYITHVLCMKECLKRGLHIYNFGTGSQIYKKELSNGTSARVSLTIQKGIKPFIRQKIVNQYIKWNNAGSPIIKPLYTLYATLKAYL